jgi:hypothetical protein
MFSIGFVKSIVGSAAREIQHSKIKIEIKRMFEGGEIQLKQKLLYLVSKTPVNRQPEQTLFIFLFNLCGLQRYQSIPHLFYLRFTRVNYIISQLVTPTLIRIQ